MKKKTSLRNQFLFHVFVNIAVVILITGASYYHTPLQGGKDTLVYLIHLVLLQTTVAGLIYFLSLFRWVFYISFPLVFISLSGFAFFAYSQDISITSGLIQAVVETKPDIAIDLVSWPYIFYLLATILVVFLILKWYQKVQPTAHWKIWILPAVGCVALYFIVESKRYNTFKSRLPYNVYFGAKEYLKTPEIVLNDNPLQVSKTTDSLKVVFVLGETVRADHLQLNGYSRNTTPNLSKRDDVISWKKLYTSNTYTATSVPQILTDKNLDELKDSYQSVYAVANAGGFHTTWIGNQTLEKSFSPIVETNTKVHLIDAYKSEYSFNKEYDGAMLPVLDSVLPKETNQLITLHMMGSHWYYENRYTEAFRTFTPIIDSKYIPSLTKEQLVNSYDNTILYLDYFLNEIILTLEKQDSPTALVYIADHGENLGENGQYLHAGGGDAVKNPAALFWFSSAFKESYPEVLSSVEASQDTHVTTNEIFPLLLQVLGITPE